MGDVVKSFPRKAEAQPQKAKAQSWARVATLLKTTIEIVRMMWNEY